MTTLLTLCVILGAGLLLVGIVELAQMIVRVANGRPWGDVPNPEAEDWHREHTLTATQLIRRLRRQGP